MRYHSLKTVLASLPLLASSELHAQRPTLSAGVRSFVAVDSPIVALTHARVIDGTGAPARVFARWPRGVHEPRAVAAVRRQHVALSPTGTT